MTQRRRIPITNAALAVAYIRVSKDTQELGPEAQRAAILAWAAKNDCTIVQWCEDIGVSGAVAIDERPGMMSAIASLTSHGAGLLVVAKRDRLARDAYAAVTAERMFGMMGVRVASSDGAGNGDTDADRLLRRILDAASEHERAVIRARTKAALAAKRAKGERSGTIPYGFRVDVDGVRLVPHEGEQATIARARALRAEGLSLRQVTVRLEDEGHTSRRSVTGKGRVRGGKGHGPAAVHAMLTST